MNRQSADLDQPDVSDALITDLQHRVTFQEDMLQALNRTVAEQDASIRQLQKQIQLLSEKLTDVANNVEQSGHGGEEAAPPHY